MAFDSRLLAGVGVLAAVVESGNFARAAEALSLTPSGVSRAVARLEMRPGVRLFDRTPRAVTLTDEAAGSGSQARKARRQYQAGEPGVDIDPEPAAHRGRGAGHFVGGLLNRGEQRTDLSVEAAALVGEGHGARRPIEQAYA